MNLRPDFTSNAIDSTLRWKLRALRRDLAPSQDLWPGIAARLHVSPPTHRINRKSRRMLPFALAASLALVAFAVHGPLRPPLPTAETEYTLAQHQLIQAQTETLVYEYQTALKALVVGQVVPQNDSLTLLDTSAKQLRTALADHPQAHFLLAKLHRVYARRLALTQQSLNT